MTLQGRPTRAYLRHDIRDKDIGDQIVALGISVIWIVVKGIARLIRCLEVLIVDDPFDAVWCQSR